MNAETHAQEKLWHMIKDIKFAMFTTQHVNGHLHSRPMTTQNRSGDEDDSLWFFMSRKSDPVEDIVANPTVNLSYADPDADRYVSVSGKARISNDMVKRRALWNKIAEAWFPGGVDDPDLTLVEVEIQHAHYWDVKQSKVRQLFTMAKAAVTGKPPSNMGESGEVQMR